MESPFQLLGKSSKSINDGLLNARERPVAGIFKNSEGDARVAITNFILITHPNLITFNFLQP